ncbi:MAG: MBL fold metallo-hydrolase [Deltaproteobacteria bacterium]|nr:MBL fold metallo-hydrolase [Deltaproteobacteria bacterium]
MKRIAILVPLLLFTIPALSGAGGRFEKDTIETSSGNLEITFIGHGTLMFSFRGMIIHVDPWTKLADYSTMPEADIILLTHEHRDHLDPEALKHVRTEKTRVVMNQGCADRVQGGIVMHNGEERTVEGLVIRAVPAYNVVHKRPEGQPYHPKGIGNGYVIHFGDKRVYVAGDTENIPEMKDLEGIDIAFLPMNLPYTMTPEMVADAVKAFKPKVLYPYHYGDTDTSKLEQLMKDVPYTEVRIRDMR